MSLKSIDASIRQAFEDKDGNASKKFHQTKLKLYNDSEECSQNSFAGNFNIAGAGGQSSQTQTQTQTPETTANVKYESAEEVHKKLGDYVKSIIYGGLDGIITTFAVVAGVQGADLNPEVIVILGIANLVADAISMGFGDFLSERAELDFAASEMEREHWEFNNFQEGEIQEMIQIYTEKNIDNADAELILRCMAKYPEFFVEHMMIQELELQAPSGDEQPAKAGLVTFLSFICFGSVPLLSYAMFEGVELTGFAFDLKFAISIVLTLATLFLLGFIKAKLTGTNNFKSGLWIMLNGAIAAFASFLIGLALAAATRIHENNTEL